MSASTTREPWSCRAGGRALEGVRIRLGHPTASATLVFLHEGLGSVAQWGDFPDALCGRLHLDGLAYDRAGHGRSAPSARRRTDRYLHEEAHDVLPVVLEAAAIAQPILIGHSDGGTIALLFAARFAERCAAVVTEAAHVFVEELTIAGIRNAVAAWQRTDLEARLARYHGDNTELLFRDWSETWLSPSFRGWNVETDIGSLTCPLLLLQGAGDEYGTPGQVEAIAAGVSGPVERQSCRVARIPTPAGAGTRDRADRRFRPATRHEKGRGKRMRLSGRKAFVTGAAAGIGKAIAEVFAREGAAVVLADLDVGRVEAAAGPRSRARAAWRSTCAIGRRCTGRWLRRPRPWAGSTSWSTTPGWAWSGRCSRPARPTCGACSTSI